MIELGELERKSGEFEKRGAAIYVVSNDDRETSEKTQDDYPHLRIVADHNQNLANAVQVLQEGMQGPDGKVTNAPTTFVLGRDGVVKRIFREARFLTRPAPNQLLEALDQK